MEESKKLRKHDRHGSKDAKAKDKSESLGYADDVLYCCLLTLSA
jgi:phosphosulfolactate phosphohydrolase-like enzyme